MPALPPDLKAWRRAERERLIAALDAELRRRLGAK
jgi:hypothetical protein